jgi:hypothetical protein
VSVTSSFYHSLVPGARGNVFEWCLETVLRPYSRDFTSGMFASRRSKFITTLRERTVGAFVTTSRAHGLGVVDHQGHPVLARSLLENNHFGLEDATGAKHRCHQARMKQGSTQGRTKINLKPCMCVRVVCEKCLSNTNFVLGRLVHVCMT